MTTAERINAWMLNEGRLLGDGICIVEHYARLLRESGVPLQRANIAQLLANPLLAAWGVIWTSDETTQYDVERSTLEMPAYIGGPFEYVLVNKTTLHKSLTDLNVEKEHGAYIDLAAAGGTDLYANLLEYGDGSIQGCTYVTDNQYGFSDEHISLIENTRHGLACALEPVAMRRSTESLLRTYIGNGPASAVVDGSIRRGEHTTIDAVVMFSDLRGFTEKTEKWAKSDLFEALNSYFDAVVDAVEKSGGDVLKFMGDGILSVFPIKNQSTKSTCEAAIDAARTAISSMNTINDERLKAGEQPLSMGIGIHLGSVTYGNIGSPSRLDFTVVGSAVNIASRVQDLCKRVGEPILITSEIFKHQSSGFVSQGAYNIRGVIKPIEVFAVE